ncbi:MAG TPA: hypothetical protein VFA18_09530 [Gemmataceae bacterium]|nr:hypothetical protein [Gemmataceae bacterium]
MASVRYVVKGQRVYPRGSDSDTITNRPLVPESPPRDKAVPNNFTFGLDIAGGRYRIDQTTRERFHAGKREAWYTRATVCAFDGKATQQATPHQPDMPPELARGLQNPDARIITGNVRAGVLAYDYWPLLFGHGIIPTWLFGPVPGARLRRLPEARTLSVAGHAHYQDRDCLVLRTRPMRLGIVIYDEYWVDPERQSAVLRYATYAGGKADTDLEMTYARTALGWLTQRWTYTFRPNGRTKFYNQMRVQQTEFNPALDDETFKVDLKPGMIVVKQVMGGKADNPVQPPLTARAYYEVEDDGGLRLLKTQLAPERHGWPAYVWALIGLVCALLALLGGRLWYRRRAASIGAPAG